jgi:hypothetical protein
MAGHGAWVAQYALIDPKQAAGRPRRFARLKRVWFAYSSY